MPPVDPADIALLAPVLVLCGGGLLVLLLGAYLEDDDRRALPFVSLFTTLLAMGAGVAVWGAVGVPRSLLGGTVVVDRFGVFMAELITASTALAILCSTGYDEERGLLHGEYYGLILLGAAGMTGIAFSAHLVTLFVAFETFSIAVYVLTAIAGPGGVGLTDGTPRERAARRSAEGGLKYFVYGAFASAFLLYGIGLVYGATGSLAVPEILGAVVPDGPERPAIFWTGFGLLLAGVVFKVGAVPFHWWIPDAYQGAPISVTAFMSTAVKVAAFALLLRVAELASVLEPAGWQGIAWAICALSIVCGNVLALVQDDLKRMLAYSSIAHAGYALLAFVAVGHGADLAVVAVGVPFYLVAYAAMTIGAFGVLIACGARTVDDLQGMFRRRPRLAGALTLFLVSLGGLPLTGGFVGKLVLFRSALMDGLVVLTVVAVVGSVVSFGYYLRPIVAMIHRDPGERTFRPPHPTWAARAAVVVAAGVTLLLGIYPEPVLRLARQAAESVF